MPLLLKGGFYHAGQVCVSVQRIFAQRQIAKPLAERLAEAAGAWVGDPTLPETEVGPLIRPARCRGSSSGCRRRSEAGPSERWGGRPLPTLAMPPPCSWTRRRARRVMTREVFGPVVCVSPFDAWTKRCRANALPWAFQAAVFTRDLDTALRAARRLDASAVMVNDHTAFRVDWMPFAGLRQSGLGVGGIPYTMDEMQVEKMVVVRSKEL